MADKNDAAADRIANALERIADSLVSLETLFVEREKKFAARADKPRSFGGDRGGPRSGGFKRDFGDRPQFKKRYDNDDDAGARPFKKRFDRDDDRGPPREDRSDGSDFKKRGPRSTFRDFDAPKNFGSKGGPKKPGGFKGKKKF